MGNLNKKTLSLLSLLSIVGILSMPLFMKTDFIIMPMIMCLIGGVSFGILLKNKIKTMKSITICVHDLFMLRNFLTNNPNIRIIIDDAYIVVENGDYFPRYSTKITIDGENYYWFDEYYSDEYIVSLFQLKGIKCDPQLVMSIKNVIHEIVLEEEEFECYEITESDISQNLNKIYTQFEIHKYEL